MDQFRLRNSKLGLVQNHLSYLLNLRQLKKN